MSNEKLRVAVLADFAEEGWPSMDLVASELMSHARGLPKIEATLVQPAMLRLASRWPAGASSARRLFNVDRAIGRYVQYPVLARSLSERFDLFHIADHTYAHLGLALPAGRVGVFCHDIDAFRALASGAGSSLARRGLAAFTLAGLRTASVVFHSTSAVRQEIETHALVDSQKLVHAPYGVPAEFTPGPPAPTDRPTVLHVGSLIPRKNPEFLLGLVARLRRSFPELLLLQVGGTWSKEQRALLDELGLAGHVHQVRGISRAELAAHYRSARLVLVPSKAEGFGLPVTEALACGAVVVASDIPVLRETGGDAALYCRVSDLDAWEAAAKAIIEDPRRAPEMSARLAQARRFSWRVHTETIFGKYGELGRRLLSEGRIERVRGDKWRSLYRRRV